MTRYERIFSGATKAVTAVLLSTAIAACSIGDGNTISRIEVRASTTDVPHEAFTCFLTQLSSIGVFENGAEGRYTNRTLWSSSDESVALISNGDIPLPSGDGNYALGILIPVAPGFVTISAEYLGLKASLDVEVRTGSVEVWPENVQLGQGNSISMRAVGLLDAKAAKRTIDATFLVDWSVEPAVAPDETVTINENGPGAGLLTAEAVTGGTGTLQYTVTADPRICDISAAPAADLATSTVTVDQSPVASLSFYEETDLTTAISTLNMPAGTSRGLRVFANHDTLSIDITTIVGLTTSDDTAVTVPALFRNGVVSFLGDATTNTATITAAHDDNGAEVTADLVVNRNGLVLDASQTPPVMLSAPFTPGLIIPGSTLDLDVSAIFCDPTDCVNTPATVNMLRDVSWFIGENDTIGGVQTASGFQGQAFAGGEDVGDFSITARYSDTSTDPATDYDSDAVALSAGPIRVNSIAITTAGGCPVTLTNPGDSAQLRVIAAIDLLDTDGTTVLQSSSQDVSRLTTWTSANPADVHVYNVFNDNRFFGPNPGDVLRLGGGAQTVTAELSSDLVTLATTPMTATCDINP